MPLYLGTTQVPKTAKVYSGITPVKAIYAGTTEVWPELELIYQDGPIADQYTDWSFADNFTVSAESTGVRVTCVTDAIGGMTLTTTVVSGDFYRVEVDTGEIDAPTATFGADTIWYNYGASVVNELSYSDPTMGANESKEHDLRMEGTSLVLNLTAFNYDASDYAEAKYVRIYRYTDTALYEDLSLANDTASWTESPSDTAAVTATAEGLEFSRLSGGGAKTFTLDAQATDGDTLHYIHIRTGEYDEGAAQLADVEYTIRDDVGDLVAATAMAENSDYYHYVTTNASATEIEIYLTATIGGTVAHFTVEEVEIFKLEP